MSTLYCLCTLWYVCGMTTTETLLDPNPARPLTSREIAKIFGGIFGTTTLAQARIMCGAMRLTVLLTSAALKNDHAHVLMGIANAMKVQMADLSPEYARVIGGLVGGLLGWCREEDVLAAIDFWEQKGLAEAHRL